MTFAAELLAVCLGGATAGTLAVAFFAGRRTYELDELACIVCGCTESRACFGGCAWVSIDPPLCTTCSPGWSA